LINGGNLFAGAQCEDHILCDGGICVSTNNGNSWSWCDSTQERGFAALIASGSTIYAGASFALTGWMGGVFRSTNNGTSWTLIESGGLFRHGVGSFAVSGTGLFVGRATYWYDEGIFLTTNNGIRWDPAGLPESGVRSLAVHGANLFAGTHTGVWRRPLSEMITDVESTTELPSRFALFQNYPNPFNPVTIIQFSIVNSQLTILKVYDVLGREVATLVNEVKQPGTYTVQWDASGVASGVYFYRLEAGSFTSVKKLLLLR
jgi:hypothetical protein